MNNLVKSIKLNGGFTADQTFNAPTTGYMVSLAGTEIQLPNFETMGYEQLQSQCENYYLNRVNWNREGVYFGAWVDDGVLFFDNSINIQDRDVAIAFGRANNQLAIWDIANGSSIRLD